MNKQLFPIISGMMVSLLVHHLLFDGVFSILSFTIVFLVAAIVGCILSFFIDREEVEINRFPFILAKKYYSPL